MDTRTLAAAGQALDIAGQALGLEAVQEAEEALFRARRGWGFTEAPFAAVAARVVALADALVPGLWAEILRRAADDLLCVE